MHYLENYYNKALKYELINKFQYSKLNKLPKIKKIILSFNCQTNEIKAISASLLALELLIYQKGFLTKTNKTKLFIKIRKGSPAGCKLTLNKKLLLQFLTKNYLKIFPNIKNFDGLIFKQNKNNFSYQIKNLFNSSDLENHYHLFYNLPKFNVALVVANSDKVEELLFIIQALKIPLKKNIHVQI